MPRTIARATSSALLCAITVACSRSPAPASPSTDSGAPRVEAGRTVDDLGALLEPIRAAHELPGLSAAVFDDRGLLAIGAAGRRKLGDPTPVTTDDVWHLGSDTKAMTATLAALLVDDGVVKWTTTLAEAFPEWASTMDVGYRTVTLEMLLAHRGGAPADVPTDVWTAMWKPGVTADQRRDAVKAMLSRPPETPPGTKFVYANAGYMMVGAALERVTGKTWEQLTSLRLFDALGMSSCGFGYAGTVGHVDQPWGHKFSLGTLTPVPPGRAADNPPSLGPAGVVHCGLVDWAKFLRLHLVGAEGNPTLLSAASLAKLQTPWPGGNYALGWIVTTRPWAGGTVLTHTGSNTMNAATAWIAPKKNRIVVAVANRGDDVALQGVDAAIGPLLDAYVK